MSKLEFLFVFTENIMTFKMYCSRKLGKQEKKLRKPHETVMYWHTMDNTYASMRNIEKKNAQICN